MKIPFNIPYTCEQSTRNIEHLIKHPRELNDMNFRRSCELFFESMYPKYTASMTSSCTRAMDAIALALDLDNDDEVIMPSYNYVGIANSFSNTKAKIVFADIEPETMNIGYDSILKNISDHTKALVVMHYGAVGCEMDKIVKLCDERQIVLIEDNAQGIQATLDNQYLGSFGDFSCISFDRLKNISCGEGGVLLFKKQFSKKVRPILDIGTNKKEFEQGKVSSYEWVVQGSKFDLSEYNAAVLHPLLEDSKRIIDSRLILWNRIYDELESHKILKSHLPNKMRTLQHNAHLFYLKCNSAEERNRLMSYLQEHSIACAFHYTPLHCSKMAIKIGANLNDDIHTTIESQKLLRLPFHSSLSDDQISYLVETLSAWRGW